MLFAYKGWEKSKYNFLVFLKSFNDFWWYIETLYKVYYYQQEKIIQEWWV